MFSLSVLCPMLPESLDCPYLPILFFSIISGNFTNILLIFQEEPGWNGTEIMNGIKYVRPGGGFVPSFLMTERIDVNGKLSHPIYFYLKVKYIKIVNTK